MIPAVEQLIPHRPPMQLLDSVLAFDTKSLWAAVTLTTHSAFATPQGVFAGIGIEYLGQATAAFFTLAQRFEQDLGAGDNRLNTPPAAGMLIGSRAYTSTMGYFPIPSLLLVMVQLQSDISARTALVKFKGKLWDTTNATMPLQEFSHKTAMPDRLARLNELSSQPMASGDLSVFIPPSGQLPT